MQTQNRPSNQPPASKAAMRDVVGLLAAIDPNGPEFNRPLDIPTFPPDPTGRGPIPPTEHDYVATLYAAGRSAILRRADVQRARACHKNAAASVAELRAALQPLAALPLGPDSPDDQQLHTLGSVAITAGTIRSARRLLLAADLGDIA